MMISKVERQKFERQKVEVISKVANINSLQIVYLGQVLEVDISLYAVLHTGPDKAQYYIDPLIFL